jgi:DMSO/TMAO reductase YedYZ heme-binding membrane subunit
VKTLYKFLLATTFLIVFLIPGYTYFIVNPDTLLILSDPNTDSSAKLYTAFRFFGLYGMALLWGQIVLGPFLRPLSKIFSPAKVIAWHATEGIFAILFATLHPLLFYTAYSLSPNAGPIPEALISYLGPTMFIWGFLGNIAWVLMVITVITALLRTKPFMYKHWQKVHLLNYLVFSLAFFHSFKIGTDVQLNPLSSLYIFYGITFLSAVGYRLIYRRAILSWQRSVSSPPTQIS